MLQSEACKVPPNVPVFPHFLFFLWLTHMKPERRLTILLVSVKYRISETYPVWPLWWSGWAKQPAGFPWMGPHHTHTEHALNEGFLLCLFGTTMEQCVDYIYFTKRASNISRETHTREGGLYGVRMNSSCYVTERLLGRYFWYSASHKNNFPNLPHYTKGLSCSKKNVKEDHNIPIKYNKWLSPQHEANSARYNVMEPETILKWSIIACIICVYLDGAELWVIPKYINHTGIDFIMVSGK